MEEEVLKSEPETIEITLVLLSGAREIEETKAVDLTVIRTPPCYGGPRMPWAASEITGHFREDLLVLMLESQATETCYFIYFPSVFKLGFVFPLPSK